MDGEYGVGSWYPQCAADKWNPVTLSPAPALGQFLGPHRLAGKSVGGEPRPSSEAALAPGAARPGAGRPSPPRDASPRAPAQTMSAVPAIGRSRPIPAVAVPREADGQHQPLLQAW